MYTVGRETLGHVGQVSSQNRLGTCVCVRKLTLCKPYKVSKGLWPIG